MSGSTIIATHYYSNEVLDWPWAKAALPLHTYCSVMHHGPRSPAAGVRAAEVPDDPVASLQLQGKQLQPRHCQVGAQHLHMKPEVAGFSNMWQHIA
jgi:hypothetical protein